jgi:hypothetical protein
MAPLIVKDKVIVGNSGGELGVRGWVAALDLATGKELWRAYHSGPDADVRIGPGFKAFYAKDQGKDLGVSSWPPDQWKLGGGTAWGWISYDPTLDLIFYGTGNPGVWNPDMRPGDNKWSCTIFARSPDDGMARWAFQISPHDAWDYDEIMENVLVDMQWHGQMRKLLVHPGRTGFVFVLDRESGELLSAEKFEPVNWAERYDLATGAAVEVPEKRTREGAVTRDICPSSTGGKEVIPSAFSPRTGLLYIPAHNTCMDYEGMEANYIAGTPGTSRRPRRPGASRTRSCRSTAACSQRRATWCSSAPWTAGSTRSTRALERSCGSSRPRRASSAIRSPISAPTASSTSQCTPVWAAGWAPSPSRACRSTIRTPGSAWSAQCRTSRAPRRPAAWSTSSGCRCTWRVDCFDVNRCWSRCSRSAARGPRRR